MKASIMLNNFDLSKAIDNSDPVVTPMPPAPCGKAVECPIDSTSVATELMDFTYKLYDEYKNKVKPLVIEKPESFDEQKTGIRYFPEEWEGLAFCEFITADDYKNWSNIWNNWNIHNVMTNYLNVGIYDVLRFKTPDNKTSLLLRIGRISETEWKAQILEQDERFREGEHDPIEGFRSKFKIETSVCFSVDTAASRVYLRGFSKSQDLELYTFEATNEQVQTILESLLDWSQNWEGFQE